MVTITFPYIHFTTSLLLTLCVPMNRVLWKIKNTSVWSSVIWAEKRRSHGGLFIFAAARPWKNTAQMMRRKTKKRAHRKAFCPPQTLYVCVWNERHWKNVKTFSEWREEMWSSSHSGNVKYNNTFLFLSPS